ncbi:50S ribosomal protein L13 [Candidatus Beckwithbacteria bacterium CG10_big_fil_rev_8_21_14_0_10_34_10]|uniref:Large ribosomal subunit protein uL13 n=1 Tax=Candidatus Beckwithbacteria bacterium CG10_big_fil_rev_8_21_14_0_10_34_10 TaxID=1974495 RepID=A0A2H0W7U3_9BACT|nr:MAG: 50S ribosomal protein L13 [Candidatus Beckwithbacteria bacterium CG10_big_fil_rev_8_21_14_0_10_34_10]
MTTYSPKLKDIKREWHLVDLKARILGRVASEIAQLLIGKHKVYYVSHLDCGDYVVCLNASKIKVSGGKEDKKIYYRHSGYPGGLKEVTFRQQMEKNPRKIIEMAIKNMLPKNKLRDKRMARLKVFSGQNHNFEDKFSSKKNKKENKEDKKVKKNK